MSIFPPERGHCTPTDAPVMGPPQKPSEADRWGPRKSSAFVGRGAAAEWMSFRQRRKRRIWSLWRRGERTSKEAGVVFAALLVKTKLSGLCEDEGGSQRAASLESWRPLSARFGWTPLERVFGVFLRVQKVTRPPVREPATLNSAFGETEKSLTGRLPNGILEGHVKFRLTTGPFFHII